VRSLPACNVQSMIVWHVTTKKKLLRYIHNGGIRPPVRAWTSLEEAKRFSIQTGRRIILRLKFPDNCRKLEGHRGKAVVYDNIYPLTDI